MHFDNERFLQRSAFYANLTDEQRARTCADLVVRQFPAGEFICREGRRADNWLATASGLVRIQNTSHDGKHTTLTHFSTGCWFGEGTLLKEGTWPFDAIAVTSSSLAMLPRATFEWLLNSSVPFNRFLLNQLNARLAQFVERCAHKRLHDADHHVVHCLVEMVDPRLYPGAEDNIKLSQIELAQLAGVSRSIVNRVLQRLEHRGMLKVNYRSITLLDAKGLRRFSDA